MTKLSFPITGMHCASCAVNLQHGIQKVPGVHEASVNYANEEASVEFDESVCHPEQVAKAVTSLGYTPHMKELNSEDVVAKDRAKELSSLKVKLVVSGVLNLILIGSMLPFAPHFLKSMMLMWLFSTPIQFWAGGQYYRSAWSALRHRTANMDTLIALGTSVAYFYSCLLYTSDAADE